MSNSRKNQPMVSLKPAELGKAGFALVATLSLMVLLTILAIGLLSLSAVTLRNTGQSAAQAEARANARMALMVAIGELQKQMGPDQRISANGAILSDSQVNHPQWMGVWDSWIAGPLPETRNPRYPGTLSHHQTIGTQPDDSMRPSYARKNEHFRSWLLSLKPEEAINPDTPKSLTLAGERMPGKTADAVLLVGSGSLGTAATATEFVSARLLPVMRGSSAGGRYGWWVGDESQKARIMNDSYKAETSLTMAQRIFRQQAPDSTGTTAVVGLENLTDDKPLSGLASLSSLNLVKNVIGKPANDFHSITPFSNHVLCDVREGGLKRDLSALLERPISTTEITNEFMLYKFTTKDQWLGTPNQECVPIQDLAAYYQLYDGNQTAQTDIDHSTWKRGVRYTSNILADGIQVVSPFYGLKAANDPAYFREYTNLYRQPVPIKIQFLVSMFANPVNPPTPPTVANPTPDTHELLLGITPSVTLWNPRNVPMVMNFNASQANINATLLRTGALPIRLRFNKNNGGFISSYENLSQLRGTVDGNKPELLNLYFSGTRPIRFEPGEVKVFSLPFSGDLSGKKTAVGFTASGAAGQAMNKSNFWFKTDKFFEPHEVVAGWEPQAFMLLNRSATGAAPHVVNNRLRFKTTDTISFDISADSPMMGSGDITAGGAVSFMFNQTNHQDATGGGTWTRRHYVFNSRNGNASLGGAHNSFNQRLLSKGYPGQNGLIVGPSRTGTNIIARANTADGWPFMQFSLQAGVETSEASNGGIAAGRKFASRPFLHSSPVTAPFLDDHTGNSLYNVGWNWAVDPINDVFEAPVQVSADDQGYYGGGYTPESGTTHVVQQEIPLVPPMSIAALSHAHLGGYTLANAEANGYANQNITAVGQAGLFPHTLQAIGNSYAHPNIPADLAFTTWNRIFDTAQPGGRPITVADHSYLANKALWDEFFFSSITPQPSAVKVFESSQLSAKDVANGFFFGQTPLPNRRMTPYTTGLEKTDIDSMFSAAGNYTGGLADLIAARLMVEGAFNVNSTSVAAWKVFFSSLKGKPVTYLDHKKAMTDGVKLSEMTPKGVLVGSFTLPNGEPVKGSTADPSEPGQWLGARELSDDEIGQLAIAMVKQVKLRGPFLSLSEFVNRRLDAGNPELAVKGALQAALDDNLVAINEGFRSKEREFSNAERGQMSPAFPAAMNGSPSYGSAAYIDQADILRHLSSQLTPRGDTFVIRAYGDSLDADGNVTARAWCEAVVQRLPVYIDPLDAAHAKQSDLQSPTNKNFGRKSEIISFRWLNSSEV